MNVVIDVGNTRMKYACFDGERFVEAGYEEAGLMEMLKALRQKGERVEVLLSGSGRIPDVMREGLKQWADRMMEASPLMPLPLKIVYSTTETLGFDRVAICVGACELFPAHPLLVIDTGTCLTFNYVNAEGTFLGGNISPGAEMRFRSMHHFTARLPYADFPERHEGVGHSTVEALQCGVVNGILFEVEGYITRFMKNNSEGKVVITGGYGQFLSEHLTVEVTFCDILGFIGLNRVFMFVKNKD